MVEVDEPMRFRAGQYLRLHPPGADFPRAYSIANAPRDGGCTRLAFHLRRSPGGLTTDRYVFAGLAPGVETRWSGPYGRFQYRDAEGPVLFVAGGTRLARSRR